MQPIEMQELLNQLKIQQIPLNVAAEMYSSGMMAALNRSPKVQMVDAGISVVRPKTISLPFKPPKIKTLSLTFRMDDRGAKKPTPVEKNESQPKDAAKASEPVEPPEQYTRLKPPREIVKLEDRLQYLLQPPLECWAAGEEVRFPFKPFPYQFEGIAFLYPRSAAMLADEMGLGKTMQTISTIRLLLKSGELSQVLLICPKPLVFNWQREFALWAPEIPIQAIEGDTAKRQWLWTLQDVPLKIANYEVLARDKEVIFGSGLEFDLVVLDEAQRVKNVNNASAQIVRALPRKRSWALTGTPVENSPEDLVGIFEFIAPGYLRPEMKPRELGELANEYVLRRTKDNVLTEMPPKMFRDVDIELSAPQQESYQLAEDKGVLRLEGMGKELTIQHVFELVLRLKQICNFDPLTDASSKADQIEAELEEVAASGQKALIFSQWVWTLEKLAKRLKRFNPLEYHGRIPNKKRAPIIDTFKADPKHSVLLMSYGAGGVGLNLQFATYVFLYDRWWNPAIEDQAINRAHRIGAAGAVTVTRFLAANTIEQRIDAVLQHKREIFQSIFEKDTETSGLGLSKDEIFGLFKLTSPQGPIDVVA